jgi:hypothetical protein
MPPAASLYTAAARADCKLLAKGEQSLNGRTPVKQIISAQSTEEGLEEIIDLLNGFKLGMAG